MLKTISVFLFKSVSAIGVSLFFAILGQILIDYKYFSFMFVLLTVFFAFFTLTKKLKFIGTLIVDLVFVLIVVLGRLYIHFADKGDVI